MMRQKAKEEKNRIKRAGKPQVAAAGRKPGSRNMAGGAAIAQEVSETDPTVTVQADEADAAAAGLAGNGYFHRWTDAGDRYRCNGMHGEC